MPEIQDILRRIEKLEETAEATKNKISALETKQALIEDKVSRIFELLEKLEDNVATLGNKIDTKIDRLNIDINTKIDSINNRTLKFLIGIATTIATTLLGYYLINGIK